MVPDDLGDDLGGALRRAEARLAGSGVPTPRADALALAAHLLAMTPGEVAAAAVRGAAVPAGLDDLVGERARRVPLQHLTGKAAFRALELDVGPGVFVPRPETELVAGAAVEEARSLAAHGLAPRVVDLCTGSGAIALAVATEVPEAVVHAVELDVSAHAWAQRNLAGTPVDLRLGDARDGFADLDGTVDVVVSNPPYIPPDAVPVDPEVRDHDPALALFGQGEDGLDVPRVVLQTAARLLRPGGLVVVEHADVQQAALVAELELRGWQDPRGYRDLSGRPRWVTARRWESGSS